jgi:hypothetical protein
MTLKRIPHLKAIERTVAEKMLSPGEATRQSGCAGIQGDSVVREIKLMRPPSWRFRGERVPKKLDACLRSAPPSLIELPEGALGQTSPYL